MIVLRLRIPSQRKLFLQPTCHQPKVVQTSGEVGVQVIGMEYCQANGRVHNQLRSGSNLQSRSGKCEAYCSLRPIPIPYSRV